MNAIETHALEKSFRGKRAVRDLELTVGRGEIYGFIGKNGSGKSTTMKIIAGLVPASSGEVRVLGSALAPCEAHPAIGTLIESPGIYPNLSAFDNLMVKALALGLVDARRTCHELLETVGLADTGKQKAKRFSMGMKQRLGIALALMGDPSILLLDEPLNGLDPDAARSIRTLIVRLNRERGVTVLISSHVLDQLERMCTAYGIIRGGHIVRELTAAEVEEECASYLALRCSEPARALATLNESLPGARIALMPDDTLRLDGVTDTASVGELLMSEGIAVAELTRTEGDREAFFVELMGGHDVEEPPAPARGIPGGRAVSGFGRKGGGTHATGRENRKGR